MKGEGSREFAFTPRIINSVKIEHAIIFSAEEEVRKAKDVLREDMPWTEVSVFTDSLSVAEYTSSSTSVLIMDDTAMIVTDTGALHQNNEDILLVLLSSNDFIHRSPSSVTREKFPYTSKADLIFAIDRDEFQPRKIITSAVRCAEDLLNIEKYSEERRFIFLIVDDEPRWFSQFLPVLYNIIGQRADVMVTRTYEEALLFLFGVDRESEIQEREYLSCGHGDDMVCIITDIFFPKGDNLESDAGRDLIRLVNRYYPRIPVIIASKAKEAYDLKEKAFILPKGDPGSIQTLREYIHDFTGLGEFLMHSTEGEELFRLKDIQELFKLLKSAEKDTQEGEDLRKLLERYAEIDAFSTWLYMHGFRELGDIIRPKHSRGAQLVADLKKPIEREIERMKNTPLVIGEEKIFSLQDLLRVLKAADPGEIQKLSDNDVFSTWLDCKACPELAGELRPIHGSGDRLKKALIHSVEKWIEIYQQEKKDVLV